VQGGFRRNDDAQQAKIGGYTKTRNSARRKVVFGRLEHVEGKTMPTIKLSMWKLPGQFPFQLLFVDLVPVTLHQW